MYVCAYTNMHTCFCLSLSVYIYIDICIFIYACLYVYVACMIHLPMHNSSIYLSTYLCIYLSAHQLAYECMRACIWKRVCIYIYVTVYRYKHVVQGIYTCRRMFADIVRVYARTYVCMCAWYGMVWYGMGVVCVVGM